MAGASVTFTQAAAGGTPGPLQYGTPEPGNYQAGAPVHAGRDVLAKAGSAVYALVSGVVTGLPPAATPGTSAPQEVAIQTASGEDLIYEHIRPGVALGTRVQRGQQIGTVSAPPPTGQYNDPYGQFVSNAPHVHLQAVLPGKLSTWWLYSSTEDPMALIGRTSQPVNTSTGNSRGPSRTGGSSVGHDATTNPNGSYSQQQQGQQTGGSGGNGNIPVVSGLLDWLGTVNKTQSNLQQTAVDLSTSLDTVARWIPIIVVLVVFAVVFGRLKGTHIQVGPSEGVAP